MSFGFALIMQASQIKVNPNTYKALEFEYSSSSFQKSKWNLKTGPFLFMTAIAIFADAGSTAGAM